MKAEKAEHGFANGGKITDLFGNNLNYQGNIAGVELADTTTIRFIGRVAGGAVQGDLPLGMLCLKNNLGKDISINLALQTGLRYRLRRGSIDSTITTSHLLPGNIADSSKVSKTIVTYKESSLVIKPDPITGEFVADVIPAQFIAGPVEVTGWGDLLNGGGVSLNLTDKFLKQSSSRHYKNSIYNIVTNSFVKKDYFDSISYNASYKFIKRVNPSVEIVQKDESGKALPYFGNQVLLKIVDTSRKERQHTSSGHHKGWCCHVPVWQTGVCPKSII